ncbi:hypothetical protein Tcan_11348 [Toxocara canis]|uniref:Uncharacterized protein n=1 Tax=Toxocara canis TaxID=6265 RepID=A0A0B2VR61_TOXCA|nr:hypothetical protein Tcan_11348 [Toxocara canis]
MLIPEAAAELGKYLARDEQPPLPIFVATGIASNGWLRFADFLFFALPNLMTCEAEGWTTAIRLADLIAILVPFAAANKSKAIHKKLVCTSFHHPVCIQSPYRPPYRIFSLSSLNIDWQQEQTAGCALNATNERAHLSRLSQIHATQSGHARVQNT